MVGATLSTLVGEDDDCKASARWGVAGGVELGYQLTDRFGLSLGLLYSQHRYELENHYIHLITHSGDDYHVGRESRIKYDAISVPVLAKFYVLKGLSVKGGLQLEFLRKITAKQDVNHYNNNPEFDEHYTLNTDVKDNYHSLNLSLPVGLAYEYKGFVVDARYHIGLTKVVSSPGYVHGSNADARNSVFQMTLGYKFDLSK